MRVLITKVTDSDVWYSKLLNTIVDVEIDEYDDKYYKVKSNNGNSFIKKENCEVVKVNKLNIKNEYSSKDIFINYYKNFKYTKIGIKSFSGGDSVEIRIGENYDTTLDQANQILKIMNLPYELVDEINWDKVGIGTRIKFERTPFDKGDNFGFVHSYVKELSKVVLIYEDDLIIKDIRQCEMVI